MKINLLLMLTVIMGAIFNIAMPSHCKNLAEEGKYQCQKIAFGSTADLHSVNIAIDDSENMYLTYGGKVIVYDKQGKNRAEIVLETDVSNRLSSSMEVSSNADLFFIQKINKPYNTYLVFNKNGSFVRTLDYNAIVRISGNNMYLAEKYSLGKKAEMCVLDRELNRVIDFNKYYLPNINLNEKPIGYLDNGMNLYYMWYKPEITKIGPSGAILWTKKIPFDAENWRLIGVDADSNLYALVYRDRHSGIVKLNSNLQVIAYIPIEAMLKNTDIADSAEEDGSEVYNFIVLSNGDIYIKNAHPSGVRKREYLIYKFEMLKATQ